MTWGPKVFDHGLYPDPSVIFLLCDFSENAHRAVKLCNQRPQSLIVGRRGGGEGPIVPDWLLVRVGGEGGL